MTQLDRQSDNGACYHCGRGGPVIKEPQVFSGALHGAEANSLHLVLMLFAVFAARGSNIPRIHVS